MKLTRNKIIICILGVSLLAIVVSIFWEPNTNKFEKSLGKYNRSISVVYDNDTLSVLVQPTYLEEVNRASVWLLIDLLAYDAYSSMKPYKNYKYAFVKRIDTIGYVVRSNNILLEQNYKIHSNCLNFLKMKRYIYDSCSYDWVMNGNKAMWYLKSKMYDLDSLTGGKYIEEGTPDIISIMTGMGSNCCLMRENKQLSFLLSLDEISKDKEFRKIWPEYGDGQHIKAIINMCFEKK